MSTDAKTFLLTGGRAPCTLELARLLYHAGHRVIVAESLRHHLCRFSRAVARNVHVPPPRQDPDGFLSSLAEIVNQEKVNVLIPTCEEVFTLARGSGRFPDHCRVWVEPIERLTPLHNKWTFIQEAGELGLQTPMTWMAASHSKLTEILRNINGKFPIILKPVYSRFAAEVYLLRHPAQPCPALSVSPEKPWIVQEWIDGRQICTYSLAFEGKLIAHCAYRTTFTAGKGSSILFTPIEHPQLLKHVEEWMASKKYTGQFSFDWIETAEGKLYPIECNPRATSGIHCFGESDRLDQAFARPETASLILPQAGVQRMLSLAMWSYGLFSVRSFSQWRNWIKSLLAAQDVVFRWRDPLPFICQFLLLIYFWKQSRRHQISMLEASTYDIEWNGEY
ncbi:carbamoylphosphate synthase large subunit [Paenactinomyces guangxiensis]|uniref:Carbamoylphosphate synthase large subunit n=1 Tax=Paenactinomyces guangxiensis TaxID=1490290 RepID=A0A7W2A7R3_9BACL|nr:carbamoylphosphate synthase large subunit [Paenactinomyces guangxiensis]MBA4493399.1 carbamoylphosphate synthase large subunit [Paenactinomyces guangxiensis]MBH8590489.1 carbamoylphosphate synthase large subunit [Paenactinomyces guangxiensis]